jgi:hypothetical protein
VTVGIILSGVRCRGVCKNNKQTDSEGNKVRYVPTQLPVLTPGVYPSPLIAAEGMKGRVRELLHQCVGNLGVRSIAVGFDVASFDSRLESVGARAAMVSSVRPLGKG